MSKQNQKNCEQETIHLNASSSQALTVLGATADPEVQYLVFLGFGVLSGVVAQPHPQTPPGSRHLFESKPHGVNVRLGRKEKVAFPF